MWEVSDWSSYSVYTQKSFPDCSLYFCIMLCKEIDTAQFFWQIDFEFFNSNYVSFLFYRLTGSQTRTPAPQICAPWSAKSRRTAQHTVLACKRVSQNYAYVWNYLNSKKKIFFFLMVEVRMWLLLWISSAPLYCQGLGLVCFVSFVGQERLFNQPF